MSELFNTSWVCKSFIGLQIINMLMLKWCPNVLTKLEEQNFYENKCQPLFVISYMLMKTLESCGFVVSRLSAI